MARSVAWAVSALAERDACESSSLGLVMRPLGPGGGDGGGGYTGGGAGDLPMALAEVMLLCIATPSRDTADAALEYFMQVNTVSIQRTCNPQPNCLLQWSYL